MKTMKNLIQKRYQLDGGGDCVVFEPFGKEVSAAVVTMDGIYPAEGKKARNKGRTEYVYILDGSCKIELNGSVRELKAGDDICIHEGDIYVIRGDVRSLVIVKNSKDGTTEII